VSGNPTLNADFRRKGKQMATVPTAPATTAPTQQELVVAVMSALAEVRGCPIKELETEMNQGGGDLEMESPEAVAVIAKIERQYGDRRLAKVEDLEPEELTSVVVLAGLLRRRWDTHNRGNE
jgi:hypothetical protein